MEIVQLEPAAWARMKALRLAALRDAPSAFERTYEEEIAFDDARWQGRMGPPAAHFVAHEDGRDVGLVVGAPYDEDLGLFGMWVHPEARGRGVGGALVAAVVTWAAGTGASCIRLDVADDNHAAIALYARHGFVPTGLTATLPPPREHVAEHQRARPLP